MRDRVFVDSNIFVYLQSTSDEEKREMSNNVIESFDCVISTQVLNEVSNVLIRKANLPIEKVEDIMVGMIQSCELQIVSYETIRQALQVAKENLLGYYDSLIIASALEAGCKFLMSEDLTDGQVISEQISILNIYNHPEFFTNIP
jgi:predicted nucleic acid-binding protein